MRTKDAVFFFTLCRKMCDKMPKVVGQRVAIFFRISSKLRALKSGYPFSLRTDGFFLRASSTSSVSILAITLFVSATIPKDVVAPEVF